MPPPRPRSWRLVSSTAPFVLFCVAGYVGLSYVVRGSVEAADSHVVKRSERAVQQEEAHKAFLSSVSVGEVSTAKIPRPEND